MNIVAVVVTYNRKELLKECLNSLINQDLKLNKIIIIDNNSTDGTEETLREESYLEMEQIIYKKLPNNIGGAGGFYEGMKFAHEIGAEWIWIMDDDTIPKVDALKSFVDALEVVNGKISFLASTVYGINGNCMNPTDVSRKVDSGNYQRWHQYLPYSIVEIERATFVSLLINADAISNTGLPCKDYFIWGDDTEYTYRLTKYYGSAYVVGKSIAVHKRNGEGKLDIISEENQNRINFWYYMVRNNLINTKEYSGCYKLVRKILSFEKLAVTCLFKRGVKYRMKKFRIVNKGIFSYIFKLYNHKEFKNRFKNI